jgi:6-phosphogluconolactonase
MSLVKTFASPAALANAAAWRVVSLAKQAIEARGQFTIALCGGSTPRPLYTRLAQADLADQLDWAAVHVFWGDERAVPPDDEASNYRLAWDLWLSHVPIPSQNVHRIQGEMAPAAAAADYEGLLRSFFAARAQKDEALVARFDLVLLGMGEDGHTASLFPGAEAIHENRHWVAAYPVEKVGMWRITLTPVAINGTRQAMFLVTGAEKTARLQQVLYGAYQPDRLPAQIVRPPNGTVVWMVDEAAAAFKE